jgi:uncharacterized protein (DUF302 family)
MPDTGLITIPSSHSVRETIDRLATALTAEGIAIFARVDHAAGAASVGLTLRPTELIIFGHPKGGTPLMQADQAIGIDLPLKALAWEDAAGKVWLTTNDLAWVAQRYAPAVAAAPALAALTRTLAKLATAAAG